MQPPASKLLQASYLRVRLLRNPPIPMSHIDKLPPYLVRREDGTKVPVDPEVLAEEGTTLTHVRGNKYVLMRDGRSVPVIIDAQTRRDITVQHGHHSAAVHVSDHRDQLLAELGAEEGTSGKEASINAPMPGLVLKIHVNPGDSVQRGESLLVLEAMKMENDIKANFDGIVSAIHVATGDPVGKGALLIEFE